MTNENNILPRRFEARMLDKIGADEVQKLQEAMQQKPPTSIRVHPRKGAHLFENEERVPWCRYGRYLAERPAFVFDPLYHAGAYYAQEASSMLFANAIDFSKDLKVLDLCAAPGGKSSLLLSFLSPGSLLVSNELVGKRAVILEENLIKWGGANSIATNNRPSDFAAYKGYFDVVMIDAPCSGEGMFRKDREALEQWSEGLVTQCSMVQKEILTNAIDLVKAGGLLIYSTCTFEDAENEENVQWLYHNYGQKLAPSVIPVQPDWGVQTVEINLPGRKEKQQGYYCYPHRLKGEGQFVTAIRVTGGTQAHIQARAGNRSLKPLTKAELQTIAPFVDLPEKYMTVINTDGEVFAFPESLGLDMMHFMEKMRIRKAGTMLGKLIRQNFVPDHAMVMDGLASTKMPRVALSLEEALAYMQRKNITLPDDVKQGWVVLTYEGLDIGLAKNLGNRVNIHYPAEWRIRKEMR